MKRELLDLVRSSIKQSYLPEDWHKNKSDLTETKSGYLALKSACVEIDGQYFHRLQDDEEFVVDELTQQPILYEESITVFKEQGIYFYTSKINHDNFYEYNQCLYTREGLEAYNLVITIDDTVAPREEVYYWASDCQYHFEEEYEDEDDNDEDNDVWEYHSGPCPPDYRVNKDEPGIGFEIEKGGNPVFCGFIDKYGLFDHTGCVIELDASVDWELKTPVYPLHSEDIENKWLPQIKEAINATDHECAGGHIHLSMPPKNGDNLFDYCRPYLPLFMSMYPNRLEKDYCKAKTETQLKQENERYQAVKIWDNRIELRFPSKVYDIKSLLFRLNFCRLMIIGEYNNILKVTLAAFDKSTKMGQLIAEEYSGRELILLERITEIAMKYFNTSLLSTKSIKTLLNNLKNQVLCA